MISIRDEAVLDLLRQDRVDLQAGVTRQEVALAGETRWPDRVIERLRRNGYVIDGDYDRFRLFEEPASTETPGAPAAPSPPAAGSSGVSVDADRLFTPPSTPHHQEAA